MNFTSSCHSTGSFSPLIMFSTHAVDASAYFHSIYSSFGSVNVEIGSRYFIMGFASGGTLRTLQRRAGEAKNKLEPKAFRSRREQKKGYHSRGRGSSSRLQKQLPPPEDMSFLCALSGLQLKHKYPREWPWNNKALFLKMIVISPQKPVSKGMSV